MNLNFIESALKQFTYYKQLGDKTFNQLNSTDLFWQPSPESNSIAIIVKHMHGNMLSRWTDIFTTDGEKEWRNRDAEFENDFATSELVLQQWEQGWNCLLNTLKSLSEIDLERIIYIRNEPHTVLEAINRQLAHYPYHVGQLVFIGKMCLNDKWSSLSIPKNTSDAYNEQVFAKNKESQNMTNSFSTDKRDA